MQVPLSELPAELTGKRLALFVLNKDSRNLLRAHAMGLRAFDYAIDCLIDFSLPWRPRLHALARTLLPDERIVTDFAALRALLARRAFTHCMMFDTGYEEPMKDNLCPMEEPPHIDTPQALLDKVQRDYRHYQGYDDNAEFNMRWSIAALQYMTALLTHERVMVMNAYGARIETVEADDAYLLELFSQHLLVPKLTPELRDIPLRFVLGEDFACGKTSYLLNRMCDGDSGLQGDLWFNLVSPEALPPFGMGDMFFIKGVIANSIQKLARRRPGRPVYLKYDGRLEEFVYGIPRDRTYLIKDMHRYFSDCRFVFVHKPQSLAGFGRVIADFVEKFALRPAQVTRVRMHYDAREEPLAEEA